MQYFSTQIVIIKEDIMNLNQLANKANKEVYTAKNSARSAIEHLINAGEYLADAKAQADDFKDWVSTNLEFNYDQSIKYIRIAKHKNQVRLLERDQGITAINDIIPLIPKASEPPLILDEVEAGSLGYVGKVPMSEVRDNWHTPLHYVNMARKVMDGIELDPFSSVEANQTINADSILSLADNAFECEWPNVRSVWMNPPYSRNASSMAVEKFIKEYENGSFKEAIVLMNSSTDTRWFDRLNGVASMVCFTRGRIAFEDTEGKKSSGNTKGQVFFYIGENTNAFYSVFNEIGNMYFTGAVS